MSYLINKMEILVVFLISFIINYSGLTFIVYLYNWTDVKRKGNKKPRLQEQRGAKLK